MWIMICDLQDDGEKMKVETYVWVNKDDPRMYGEWDYEVCVHTRGSKINLGSFIVLKS